MKIYNSFDEMYNSECVRNKDYKKYLGDKCPIYEEDKKNDTSKDYKKYISDKCPIYEEDKKNDTSKDYKKYISDKSVVYK